MKTILLHCCCAPCAVGCVETLLEQGYAPTLFFANSNLAPAPEFDRRLDSVRQLAAIYRLRLVEAAYDHAAWRAAVAGLESEPERGARCPRCFDFSLALAAARCRELGLDVFATSLTVSPHKNSRLLLELGSRYERFAPFDFKKRDGFRRGRELARRYGFYVQNYCGCEFSFRNPPPPPVQG